MEKICMLGDGVTVDGYGGKAYWLNWLYLQGLRVPNSVFMPLLNNSQLMRLKEDIEFQEQLSEQLRKVIKKEECMAIRSSGLQEDGQQESLAGKYRSFLNVKNVDEVINCLFQMGSDLKDGELLGIIIQQMICPKASGVIFSSNPWNGRKTEAYISIVSGIGDKLLAGTQNGEDIKVEFQENMIKFSDNSSNVELEELENLTRLVKNIEQKLNMPVDVEWCIEEKNGELILLQCRPITTIMLKKNELLPVKLDGLKNLPTQLIENDKLWLRCYAEQKHIMISDANLLVCNCQAEQLPRLDYQIRKSSYYSGFSAVLVSPSKINGKVQRYFVGKSKNVYSHTKCHRFGVRSVADYEQLEICLNDLYQIAKKEQWTCSIIIQEILSAKYTGIIKRMQDGYMIEVAKGHFLSKGIFPMSIYLVDFDGNIKYRDEIEQIKYLDIVEGCLLEYYMESYERIALRDELILDIMKRFQSVLMKGQILIEFGILKDGQDTPYLIDCVKATKETDIPFSEIEKGTVSEGKIVGRLIKLKSDNNMEALNTHFHNNIEQLLSENNEQILFYSETPSIQLMELLNKYDSSRIGFIFKTGSLLCHFAVLLRERMIPAVRGIDGSNLQEGKYYLLDTRQDIGKFVQEAKLGIDRGENSYETLCKSSRDKL